MQDGQFSPSLQIFKQISRLKLISKKRNLKSFSQLIYPEIEACNCQECQQMLSKFESDDQRILEWLNGVQEPQKIKVLEFDKNVAIECGDYYQAKRLWKTRDKIDSTKFPQRSVRITVKGRPYMSGPVRSKVISLPCSRHTKMNQTLGIWTQQNQQLFEALPGTAFLHSADRNSGYKYLAVKPDLTEQRLCKPISDLLNQPIRSTPEAIALPKEGVIEAAIATNQSQTYHYDYQWNGLNWLFSVKVVPLLATNEVLVIVQDHDQQSHWQRGYWLNMVATS